MELERPRSFKNFALKRVRAHIANRGRVRSLIKELSIGWRRYSAKRQNSFLMPASQNPSNRDGDGMALQTWAWLATAAYAVHVMEEYTLNWRDWARGALGLPVEWYDFYVTNAVVIVLGIVSAELAPALPVAPLAYASLMLINAVLFHIWQVIRAKGPLLPRRRNRNCFVPANRHRRICRSFEGRRP